MSVNFLVNWSTNLVALWRRTRSFISDPSMTSIFSRVLLMNASPTAIDASICPTYPCASSKSSWTLVRISWDINISGGGPGNKL